MCPSVGAVVRGKSGSAWGVFHSQVVAVGVWRGGSWEVWVLIWRRPAPFLTCSSIFNCRKARKGIKYALDTAEQRENQIQYLLRAGGLMRSEKQESCSGSELRNSGALRNDNPCNPPGGGHFFNFVAPPPLPSIFSHSAALRVLFSCASASWSQLWCGSTEREDQSAAGPLGTGWMKNSSSWTQPSAEDE